MSLRRAWRWAVVDLRRSLADHDASKLMIAPLLFFGLLAVVDRCIYEVEQSANPDAPERMTRL